MKSDCFIENYAEMPDPNFPVHIALHNKNRLGAIFSNHWHEYLQFIYCISGEALIYCNSTPIHITGGDILVINSNELHYGENLGGELEYYIIRIDPSFILSNNIDSCQAKYISPLTQNLLLFENKIINDTYFTSCIEKMIDEYFAQKPGYELAVKACVYNSIVALIRNHIQKFFTKREYDTQVRSMKRFRDVFDYIDTNFSQKIDLNQLAEIAKTSTGNFCRIFKKLTGKSAVDYINELRINKAIVLLEDKEKDLNITEIAFATGFSDTNYFCRVFRKYKKTAPSQLKNLANTFSQTP